MPKPKPKPVKTELAETGEIHKKFEVKVQKIEENICQWIDDETKTIKETIEKDITSIRTLRVSVGNLKFALREGKSSDSQPILTLYKLILLLSANYYINNE